MLSTFLWSFGRPPTGESGLKFPGSMQNFVSSQIGGIQNKPVRTYEQTEISVSAATLSAEEGRNVVMWHFFYLAVTAKPCL